MVETKALVIKKVKLHFIGEKGKQSRYSGIDPTDGSAVNATNFEKSREFFDADVGKKVKRVEVALKDTVVVSEEKAEQLLNDFPDQWEEVKTKDK